MLNGKLLGAAALVLLAVQPGRAQHRKQIAWADLGSVVGNSVRAVRPGGDIVEGEATAVEADALVLRTRTSGTMKLEREWLTTFETNRGSTLWRRLGAGMGGIAGGLAGVAAVCLADKPCFSLMGSDSSGKALAAGLTGSAVLSLTGYLVGRKADRRWTTFVVVSDRDQPKVTRSAPSHHASSGSEAASLAKAQ